MDKKILGIIIAVIVVIGGVLSFYYVKVIKAVPEISAGKFVKISNVDLAPKDKIIVVEQSWYGYPVGAATSWAIYNTLKNYGNLSYELHH